jgi:hypothetical protein
VCGYKWLRALEEGEAGLHEKSRRPRSHPEQTSLRMEKRAKTTTGKPWAQSGTGPIIEILRCHGQLGQRRFDDLVEQIVDQPPESDGLFSLLWHRNTSKTSAS